LPQRLKYPGLLFSPGYFYAVSFRDGLLLRGEVLLAGSAELADEIIGEILPLYAALFLVIDPAADVANVSHSFSS
jgi:hypothetical protein